MGVRPAAYNGLGKNVLQDLISAKGTYRYRQANEGELGAGEAGRFMPSATLNRGGDMIFDDLSAIAHETLHGDLHENWLDGPGGSQWEEVQAYAFEFIMRGGLTKNPFQFGTDDWRYGRPYGGAMIDYTRNGFPDGQLANAIDNFLQGSVANNNGLFSPYKGLTPYHEHQVGVNFLKLQMGR